MGLVRRQGFKDGQVSKNMTAMQLLVNNISAQ
jgi:hypothetical protein